MTSSNVRTVLTWVLAAVALLGLAVTLVSLVHTNIWWVRALDFPREPIMFAAGGLALVSLAASPRWRISVAAAFLVTAGLQLWRLFDYTPLAATEIALAPEAERGCFTALSLNVLQHNRDHAAVAALIRRERPDVLLLMETDATWAKALAPVLAGYPVRAMRPLGNTYGMIFATRLPAPRVTMSMALGRETPSLYATLVAPGGERFELIGLHPRPPLPGTDTGPRDRQIAMAGAVTPDRLSRAVVLGDFNDVPWSATTRLLKRLGGYSDPRIGRGAFPSFPADHLWFGWPLDQIFVKRGVDVAAVRILEAVGSDHRPLETRLCVPPAGATARSG